VSVDSHVTGILEHAGGALSTLVMSFDGHASSAPPIEVHGTGGSVGVPDPNHFDGDVTLRPLGGEHAVLPADAGFAEAGRGVGLLDLARTESGRAPRANGALALHVLEVMTALLRSAEAGRRLDIETTVERPEPVPFTAHADWTAP
jgi:predicted dehydrogenase